MLIIMMLICNLKVYLMIQIVFPMQLMKHYKHYKKYKKMILMLKKWMFKVKNKKIIQMIMMTMIGIETTEF